MAGEAKNTANLTNDVIFQKYTKPRKRYPSFSQNAFDYFNEFSQSTSMHGFTYMGKSNSTLIEKLWWIIFFGVSLYFCMVLIFQTWLKWETYPVLVSFARSPTPVWQVPFPAITICSETKTRQRAYNFTDNFHKMIDPNISAQLPAEVVRRFSDLALVCDRHLYHLGNKTTDEKTIEYLTSIGQQQDEVFFECMWMGEVVDCREFFSPMLTEEGNCFTFNMLDRREFFTDAAYIHGDYMGHEKVSGGWTLENGYQKTIERDTFPQRAISSGTSAGLFLVLRSYKQDQDYICRGPVQGFKVLLHHPAELPRASTQFFRAPLDQEIVVSVKPDMMTTSEGLRNYKPDRRQCFFANERQLYFYQNYTQEKCRFECLTNYTLSQCGCVAYYMPREKSTKICGSGSNICIYQARHDLITEQVESEMATFHFARDDAADCNCLPACTSIVYNAETSQAKFDWPQYYENLRVNLSDQPGLQLARVAVFFKEMQFITSERNELFGQTDFLANCGGLLGLFTGFSFLSIVEILYFLSLRLICNIHKFGRHFWSGSDRLVNDDTYTHK